MPGRPPSLRRSRPAARQRRRVRGLEPQLERLHRAKSRSRRKRAAAASRCSTSASAAPRRGPRRRGTRPPAPARSAPTRRARRRPRPRFGPDRLPDPPERRHRKSRTFIDTWARSSSSMKNPFAWTLGKPPPDSRIRRAMRTARSRVRRLEVDVVGDEERPRADGHRARRGMHPARPEVRLAAALVDLRLEALVLAPPNVGELDPLAAGRRLRVEEDRQVEALGDPLPERAGQLDRVVHRRVAERAPTGRRRPPRSAGARPSARPCRSRGSPHRGGARAPRRPGSCSAGEREHDRLWLASLVRSSRCTPATLVIAVARGSTTSEATALGDVRHAFDGLDERRRGRSRRAAALLDEAVAQVRRGEAASRRDTWPRVAPGPPSQRHAAFGLTAVRRYANVERIRPSPLSGEAPNVRDSGTTQAAAFGSCATATS